MATTSLFPVFRLAVVLSLTSTLAQTIPYNGSYGDAGDVLSARIYDYDSVVQVSDRVPHWEPTSSAAGAFARTGLRPSRAAIRPSGLWNSRVGDATRALPAARGAASWAGRIVSLETTEPLTLYRVWGGKAGRVGGWLTPVKPSTASGARAGLSLPSGNAATFFSEVTVPAGTRIQIGTAAEAFGYSGGWPQVMLLDDIAPELFSKGIRLGF